MAGFRHLQPGEGNMQGALSKLVITLNPSTEQILQLVL